MKVSTLLLIVGAVVVFVWWQNQQGGGRITSGSGPSTTPWWSDALKNVTTKSAGWLTDAIGSVIKPQPKVPPPGPDDVLPVYQ